MALNNAAFNNLTPNAKLAMVGNRLGNPGLKNNQGSTFEVYDYIDVTATIGAKQTLRFFESVNTKTFPLTNLQQNQLQVGEALAIQYIAFTRIEEVIATGVISTQTALIRTISGLALSQFSILLDNSRIIKINSLTRANADLNPKGGTANNALWYPDTDLTIPPQISFTSELTIPANADTAPVGSKVYYGVHLFGTGAILNLKTNV
jgi:hypothetical protein